MSFNLKKKISLSKFKSESTPNIKKKIYIDSKDSSIKKKIHKDLYRFIKWPVYIKIQRQRRILTQKLKAPFMIRQFTSTLDKNITKKVLQLLTTCNFNRQTKIDTKLFSIKYGINSITKLIKKKQAIFVLIAHDVDPIELVAWLPTLCYTMDIPYSIVKNKSKLGSIVNKKTTSCLALTCMINKNREEIENIIKYFRKNFNSKYGELKKKLN